MSNFRTVLGYGAAAAALLMIAAPLADAQQLADQQVYRRGNGSEPQSMDPHLSENTQDSNIQRDLYETLVILDKDTRPVPGNAESWSISPDGKVYTFKIRANAKWSNGDDFTADDLVWSWRRAVDPNTGSKYSFLYYPIVNAEEISTGKIKDLTAMGVRAVDKKTFEVTLKSPTAYFLPLLAHGRFSPLHRASVEKFGKEFTRVANLVSNGAFNLKEATPQSRVVLVKNPTYWDAANVKLNEVQFFPIENENEEFKSYRAGGLDYTNIVPSDQVEFIRKEFSKELQVTPFLGSYYIGMNTTRMPFKDNVKLRQALSMVIDRETIVTKLTKLGEQPAYTWVPPGIPGYTSQEVEWKNKTLPERIALAKQLYQEAGYSASNPLKLELRYNTSENHKRIMIAVAQMLKTNLGVQVSLVNEEFKVFLDNRNEKKITEAFRAGWIADYADPNSFMELLQSDAGLNDMGYYNGDYDKLVKQAALTVDPPARAQLLQEAEKLVMRDMPMIPLYTYVNKHLVKPYVNGYATNLLDYNYSKFVSLAKH